MLMKDKLACNAGEISRLLVSTMVFALLIKKSLQMLRESRHENLKMLIKVYRRFIYGGTGFNNSYFKTKINGHYPFHKFLHYQKNITLMTFIPPSNKSLSLDFVESLFSLKT